MRSNIHQAFCDNINTHVVIVEIDEAIRRTYIYMLSKSKKITLLQKAYKIIKNSLDVIGL